jgi:hypothetical protein
MAEVIWDATASSLAGAAFEAALNQYVYMDLIPEMQRKADKITGLMADSMTGEPAHYLDPEHLVSEVHDGPAERAREYAVYEEVKRGGKHAFMRPSLDVTFSMLAQRLKEMFGTNGVASGIRPSDAYRASIATTVANFPQGVAKQLLTPQPGHAAYKVRSRAVKGVPGHVKDPFIKRRGPRKGKPNP